MLYKKTFCHIDSQLYNLLYVTVSANIYLLFIYLLGSVYPLWQDLFNTILYLYPTAHILYLVKLCSLRMWHLVLLELAFVWRHISISSIKLREFAGIVYRY